MAAVEEMQQMLSASLGEPVQLKPFGSMTYGVFDHTSDCDCFTVDITCQNM